MKGAIITSSRIMSEDCMSDRWRIFFRMIRDRLDFEIVNHPDEITTNPGVVLLCGTPSLLRGMEKFMVKAPWKTILYIADIHKGGQEEWRAVLDPLVEACDVHLSSSDMWFRLLWTEQIKKHVYFPYFFAPQERYTSMAFNFSPKPKCLFSGHTAKAYPLRRHIYNFAKSNEKCAEFFDVIEHPGNENVDKGSAVIGDDFAKILNKYGGCATSTISGCPTAKHFEIMASGSLLFTDRSWDLDALGLVPGRHYMEITPSSIPRGIWKAIIHLDRFQEVRMEAMVLARKKHGIEARFNQFKKILETSM